MAKPARLPASVRTAQAFDNCFAEHGVAFLEDVLTADEVTVLRERVLEQAELEREQGVAELSGTGTASEVRFAPAGAAPTPFQMISFLPNKGREFVDLLCDARILDRVSAAFAGVPFYLTSASATIVRNGAAAQVIHADQQAWPFDTPVPVMITVAVCLSDFTPEMGSTCFVPGTRDKSSPRIAMRDDTGRIGNLDVLEPQAFSAKAGAMAVWDGRIWHGQGQSRSDETRIAVIMTFAMHMVRAQDNLAASLHDDVLAGLDDRQRSIFGFEVNFEYAGRIAPRFPGDARACVNMQYPYVPELRRDGGKGAVPL